MEHSLRVMTWNLWGRYGPWRQRAPRIVATLRQVGPDVVCLQEVWATGEGTQADELAAALGLHTVFEPTRMPTLEPGSGADGLGMAILARWPVRARRRYDLPTDLPGDAVALMIVTLGHPAGDLHVATTVPVWERHAGDVRLAQTTAVAALLGEEGLDGVCPVVLAADLNARPDTAEFAALTEVLTDAWAAVRPHEAGYTFSSANRYVEDDEWLADGRIDHVLMRPGSPTHPVVVTGAALAGSGDPPPSDHYAVVVDLQWSALAVD